MKKKNKKIQAPAAAFGLDKLGDIGGMVNLVGSGLQAAGSETSGAAIAGSAISGLGSGASLGMTLGGAPGAAVGGVLGLGAGLITSIRKKNAIKRAQRRAETLRTTERGENLAAELEGEYYDNNPLANTFADGGVMSTNLAYVDNNEIIRDLNGNIDQVPNTKPGTDNHLIDATSLESVLSDKLKRPGTNKTFAQEGEKLTKMTKPSKNKDRFAENTNRLNKKNANRKYNQLLAEQEALKNAKGIKPKSKGIPAYEDGKEGKAPTFSDVISTAIGKGLSGVGNFVTEGLNQIIFDNNPFWQGASALRNAMSEYDKKHPVTINPNKRMMHTGAVSPIWYTEREKQEPQNYIDGITGETILVNQPTTPTVAQPVSTPMSNNVSKTVASPAKTVKSSTVATPKFITPAEINVTDEDFALDGVKLPYSTPLAAPSIKPAAPVIDLTPPKPVQPKETSTPDIDWLSLAPTMYNLVQGIRGPETEELVTNPYSGSIRRTMARRRMNIDPMLEANRQTRAFNRYNMAKLNPSTGANLAYNIQNAIGERAANANAYATKQNADNAYLGEYANTLNNLGQQYVQSKTLYNDNNARNRAAARSFTGSALSQLSNWSQMNTKMGNERSRDAAILPFLAQFLNQGYTQDMVNNLYNTYYNGK